jgi:hypothetical protein
MAAWQEQAGGHAEIVVSLVLGVEFDRTQWSRFARGSADVETS